MVTIATFKESAIDFLSTTKGKIVVASVPLMGMVQYASAATLNESIGPVLDSVIALFVPLLALVTAAVPLIIIMSIISFIIGILNAIIGKLRF